MSKEELAALQATNEELQAQINALQAEKQAAQAAARTAEHVQFAESLIGQGKLAEADKAAVVAIANAIHPAGADPVMFGEGDGQEPLYAKFQAFLQGLPARVEFAEVATKAAAAAVPAVYYAEGTPGEAIELDKRVRAYMAEHKLDYNAAFAAVTR